MESDTQDIRRVFCRSCNHERNVYDGIPDFAGHMDHAAPVAEPAQKLMNTRLFASLYESPIWRPLHTRLGAGISMNQEVRAILEMSGKEKAHLVADLACGTGHYTRALAGAFPGAGVYGLDISLSMLAQGRKVAKRNGLTYILFLRGDI
ncbi:MAG: class I SAM-dependent methyltransferase, partial [Thermodesulfobacteriota bacterium]|nr:class I SAM-dependent methyltransferase [Thermodesulfobacteriota bacterium]